MRKAIKGITFFIILCIIVELISLALLPFDKVKEYGLYKTSAYSIISEEDDRIDAVAIGDSLVYASIIPMEIWHGYGYTFFNCASPAQIISDSCDYLEAAIESQSPQVVFLEANVLFRNPDKLPLYKKVAYRIENYVPIVKYHSNWRNYFAKGNSAWLNVDKGYKYNDSVKPVPPQDMPYMSEGLPQVEGDVIPDGNMEYFDRMVGLCEDNGIRLVLLAVPSQRSWDYNKYLVVKQIADEYGLEFMDFNIDHDLDIDWTMETKDKGGHLNYEGAKKVSQALGEYLNGTGLMTDHRGDAEYKSWDEAYRLYKDKVE